MHTSLCIRSHSFSSDIAGSEKVLKDGETSITEEQKLRNRNVRFYILKKLGCNTGGGGSRKLVLWMILRTFFAILIITFILCLYLYFMTYSTLGRSTVNQEFVLSRKEREEEEGFRMASSKRPSDFRFKSAGRDAHLEALMRDARDEESRVKLAEYIVKEKRCNFCEHPALTFEIDQFEKNYTSSLQSIKDNIAKFARGAGHVMLFYDVAAHWPAINRWNTDYFMNGTPKDELIMPVEVKRAKDDFKKMQEMQVKRSYINMLNRLQGPISAFVRRCILGLAPSEYVFIPLFGVKDTFQVFSHAWLPDIETDMETVNLPTNVTEVLRQGPFTSGPFYNNMINLKAQYRRWSEIDHSRDQIEYEQVRSFDYRPATHKFDDPNNKMYFYDMPNALMGQHLSGVWFHKHDKSVSVAISGFRLWMLGRPEIAFPLLLNQPPDAFTHFKKFYNFREHYLCCQPPGSMLLLPKDHAHAVIAWAQEESTSSGNHMDDISSKPEPVSLNGTGFTMSLAWQAGGPAMKNIKIIEDEKDEKYDSR